MQLSTITIVEGVQVMTPKQCHAVVDHYHCGGGAGRDSQAVHF